MKCTSTLPKIDKHKHNILSPLVTCVRIIFRRKGLNRVHHRGTFSVSSNNNKMKVYTTLVFNDIDQLEIYFQLLRNKVQ